MNAEQARERLERNRQVVRARLARIKGHHNEEIDDSEMYDALDEATSARLKAIEAALIRIDEGTYGTCVRCSGTISSERLDAYPAATLCIGCAD